MRVTEKSITAFLESYYPGQETNLVRNKARAALEAAFAAVKIIPGTDVFAVADKESEVMPLADVQGRNPNDTARHASGPGGAIAGASETEVAKLSARLVKMGVKNFHVDAVEGAPPEEVAREVMAALDEIEAGNYTELDFNDSRRAPPAPSTDEVERALIAFNESWGEFALDGTERCRTAMRAALAAVLASSPGGAIAGASGLEPLDEIDQDALTELQQRADAVLGDKSRFKVIDPPPFFLPDEVERERLASALYAHDTGKEIGDFCSESEEEQNYYIDLADFAIAAMNRAPQPSSQPRVTDNDKDEITVSLNGRELRGWSYSDDNERRQKMLHAREYVEGWCDKQGDH